MADNKVLIIDDSPVDRIIMKKVLRDSLKDLIIVENHNGIGYLEQINQESIKVVILDLMIETIDGIEILKILKNNKDTKPIPVVICSSIIDKEIIKETLMIGAYDYFAKPLSQMSIQFGFALKVKNALEMKLQSESVMFLRNHDELTGLKTRKYFETLLSETVEKGVSPLSVLMVDINGLKIINDAYGHHVGDKILVELSGILQQVGTHYTCIARWGSDELMMLLPFSDEKSVEEVISIIKQEIIQPKSYSYDVSFGWAVEKGDMTSAKYLAQKAEDNLYSNKVLESSSIRSNMIETIIKTLHQKNPREEMHSHRVSYITEKIAIELGFSEYEIRRVKLAGLMHDIGKISISEDILNKPGKLNNMEWEQIKKHPEYGFKILSTSVDTMEIANAVLAHHERWDGYGYPKGLSSESIPIMSRIISVADTYDAMTSVRSYKDSISKREAIEEIKNCSGKQFDPVVVQAFLRYVKQNDVNLDI